MMPRGATGDVHRAASHVDTQTGIWSLGKTPGVESSVVPTRTISMHRAISVSHRAMRPQQPPATSKFSDYTCGRVAGSGTGQAGICDGDALSGWCWCPLMPMSVNLSERGPGHAHTTVSAAPKDTLRGAVSFSGRVCRLLAGNVRVSSSVCFVAGRTVTVAHRNT